MAKTLKEPPPSSSVARLFDSGAASRALSPIEPMTELPRNRFPVAPHASMPQDAPATATGSHIPLSFSALPPSPTPPRGEPNHVKRELVLSEPTDQTLTGLLELYRRATGTRVSVSHVARAILRGIAACMDSLEREAEHIGRLKLPSNGRGRESERERFEETLAEAFINGIRSAAAYRRRHP